MSNYIISSDITQELSRDFNEFLKTIEDNEPIDLTITSFGGDVIAGNAIVAQLRNASKDGHRTSAHVVSIAASMASVIACACDELVIDSNAFLMVHLPWTVVEGNYTTMRKEADTLELFTKSLVSIYRSKFNLSDEDIVRLLEDETWILGSEAQNYGLKCSINQVDDELRVAASMKRYGFKNTPKNLKETMMQNEEIKEEIVEEKTVSAEVEEQIEAKEVIEDKPVEVKEAMITEEEASKRVSGMQASMQKQINQIKAEYDAKITDFRNQLELKQKELDDAKTESINLQNQLDTTKQELSEMTSACAEQKDALATLNANVNKQSVNDNTDWRKLKGKEFLDWYNKNH